MLSNKFSWSFAMLCLFSSHFLIIQSYSQTQALRVGNVLQYFCEMNEAEIQLTTSTVLINGKQYFQRKYAMPWFYPAGYVSTFERIEGDSAYYILNSGNTDSLVFNFNWTAGTLFQCDTSGIYIHQRRIDSIKTMEYLLPEDTLFFISQYTFNSITGDTTYWIPANVSYSKKLGPIEIGIFKFLQGAKIDGIRYGFVSPYPEEIYFSVDSLYRTSLIDTLDYYLINSSDYDIVIDSLIDNNYYGYLTFFIRGADYFFINFAGRYPNHPLDTLKYPVAAHDSIQIQIYEIDLCPFCREDAEPRYFTDSIHYVIHFGGSSTTTSYSFNKLISVTGYAIGDVDEDNFIPGEIILHQNYPNPFNPFTKIGFSLNKRVFVRLSIYDVLGREIVILVNEERIAGEYNEIFSGADLPSGVYFYKLMAGDYTLTGKSVLLK